MTGKRPAPKDLSAGLLQVGGPSGEAGLRRAHGTRKVIDDGCGTLTRGKHWDTAFCFSRRWVSGVPNRRLDAVGPNLFAFWDMNGRPSRSVPEKRTPQPWLLTANNDDPGPTNTLSGMGFQSGDAVRVRGSAVVYKVVAVNNNLVTILISNPQPDGQYLPFTSTALQTVDESRLEKADDVS
ncbi:hypothetical protein VTI28DRAFT_5909 [Corynascus sepedonium]